MAVVDESGPSGRKKDSGDSLNPEPGRDMDLARASTKAGTATGGIPFFIHHQFDGASTSARGDKSFVGSVQLKGTPVMPQRGNGAVRRAAARVEEREIRDLEELLSKLNPMAEEFVPSSLSGLGNGGVRQYSDVFGQQRWNAGANVDLNGRKKSGYSKEKQKTNRRTSLAQREEMIRRTVYVSDIDHQVTEEQLAVLFTNCGQVVDCRVCGDPNSVLRFAFIEFTDEEGARVALGLSGTMLGYYPVKVLPSKTAIAPVNPTFLPKSDNEREMCARTIYCTNIDKKVTQAELKLFFESICGEVYRLRLLGDYHHSTRIAFVEFVLADSATAALNCSGVILGSLPIRVSPSKTPVRARPPRHSLLRM